jgi:hypothetical protein
MRRETVVDVLRVAKKLDDKPMLKKVFEEGKQGWSKIRTVANVATPETDGLWAKRVETLSKVAVQELAKEVRKQNEESSLSLDRSRISEVSLEEVSIPNKGQMDLLGQQMIECKAVVPDRRCLTFQLDADVYGRLVDFKTK